MSDLKNTVSLIDIKESLKPEIMAANEKVKERNLIEEKKCQIENQKIKERELYNNQGLVKHKQILIELIDRLSEYEDKSDLTIRVKSIKLNKEESVALSQIAYKSNC